jgi:hypothetical protein
VQECLVIGCLQPYQFTSEASPPSDSKLGSLNQIMTLAEAAYSLQELDIILNKSL